MNEELKDKQIILGVCGGIASYKSAELLRLMIKSGAGVQVIMTANAAEFVAPLTFEVLSRRKVCSDLFRDRSSAAVDHIQWAQAADAVVIAPATANMVAKMANGIADDALSTLLLAATCPILVCPSMNYNMYLSPPVQRNLKRLGSMGRVVLKPTEGEMAEGTFGPGRLPEPELIADRLQKLLCPKDLQGRRVLITAGPTREAIDPVRFLSNPSSGKMGYALARAAEMRGAQVVLVSGPTAQKPPYDVEVVQVVSAAQMAEAVFARLSQVDVLIKCAAVSDFRPKTVSNVKIKKDQAELVLSLEKTEDILKTVAKMKRGQLVIGFAAETHQLDTYGREKLKAKEMDMLVANLVGGPHSGFGSDSNEVTLYFKDGSSERLDAMPKSELAHVILDRMQSIS